MVFTRRMAALAAVVLIPLGVAATSYALSDSPARPTVPSPAVRRAVPGGAHGPGRAAGSQAEVSGTQRPSTVR